MIDTISKLLGLGLTAEELEPMLEDVMTQQLIEFSARTLNTLADGLEAASRSYITPEELREMAASFPTGQAS